MGTAQWSSIDVSDPTGWSAPSYALVNDNQVRTALAAIEIAESGRHLDPPPEQLMFADIGCGAGEVAREMAERGYGVYAIDHSLSMVAETARRCVGLAAVEVAHADAATVRLAENTFHVVHSSWVLHWIDDVDALLHELVRALVPGGHLVLQWNAGHPRDQPEGQFGILRELAATPRWRDLLADTPFVMRRHPADEVAATLERAGMAVVHREDDMVHTPAAGATPMTLVDVRERVKRTGMGQQIAALGPQTDEFFDEAIAAMVERGATSLRDSRLIATRPAEGTDAVL